MTHKVTSVSLRNEAKLLEASRQKWTANTQDGWSTAYTNGLCRLCEEKLKRTIKQNLFFQEVKRRRGVCVVVSLDGTHPLQLTEAVCVDA